MCKKILSNVGIKLSIYINLEYDFGFKKEGPFTTFNYKESDVKVIDSGILKKLKEGDVKYLTQKI